MVKLYTLIIFSILKRDKLNNLFIQKLVTNY